MSRSKGDDAVTPLAMGTSSDPTTFTPDDHSDVSTSEGEEDEASVPARTSFRFHVACALFTCYAQAGIRML